MGALAPPLARTRVADVLFSPVQQRVFGLLFGQPERSFGSAELIRLVGSGTGATHRILTRLADVGLVTVTRIGNQKHYQANPESPIFGELHGLMTKTVGLLQPLRNALEPFAGDVQAAFVYGSVAKATTGHEATWTSSSSPTTSTTASCSAPCCRSRRSWAARSARPCSAPRSGGRNAPTSKVSCRASPGAHGCS
jgi:hypothetical protein